MRYIVHVLSNLNKSRRAYLFSFTGSMSEAGIKKNTLKVDSDFFLNNVNHQLSMLHSSKDATLHVMY